MIVFNVEKTCLLQLFSIVHLVFQGECFFLWDASAANKTYRITFTLFSISAFIIIQQIDSCARSLVFFSKPMWLLVVVLVFVCVFILVLYLPLIIIPFITTRSSLNVQYGLSSCRISFLLNGQPCMMQSFNCCRFSSWECYLLDILYWHTFWDVCCCMYCYNIYLGISLSLFSSWFCCDNQSAVNTSSPGYYSILIWYSFILSSMCSSLSNSVTMSFMMIVTSGLQSVIVLTPLA